MTIILIFMAFGIEVIFVAAALSGDGAWWLPFVPGLLLLAFLLCYYIGVRLINAIIWVINTVLKLSRIRIRRKG